MYVVVAIGTIYDIYIYTYIWYVKSLNAFNTLNVKINVVQTFRSNFCLDVKFEPLYFHVQSV